MLPTLGSIGGLFETHIETVYVVIYKQRGFSVQLFYDSFLRV